MIFVIIYISGLLTVLYLFFLLTYHAIIEHKFLQLFSILMMGSFLLSSLFLIDLFIWGWYFLNFLYSIIFLYMLTYCLGSLKYKKVNSQNNQNQFSITVIVSIFNEEEVIYNTVQKLLELNYRNELLEIIIIDDNSTDNSLKKLEPFMTRVKIVKNPHSTNKGKPNAINRIVPLLKSDLIGIFDADSLPEKDFFVKAAHYFLDPKVAIVQGRNIQYNENNSFISKLTSLDIDSMHSTILKGKNSLKGMTIFEGRGAVLRRSTFVELDGFDTSLPTEDWDYGFRCQIDGYSVVYDYELCNYEQSVETVEEFYHQRFRWLSSTILTFFKNFRNVFKSAELSFFQKLDFCFPFSLALWALLLNIHGTLSIIGYVKDYQVYLPYYILLFIIMQIIYLFPALIARKKYKDLIYVPFMYIYSWSFSLIISLFIGAHYVMKKKLIFKKASHYSFNIKKHTI